MQNNENLYQNLNNDYCLNFIDKTNVCCRRFDDLIDKKKHYKSIHSKDSPFISENDRPSLNFFLNNKAIFTNKNLNFSKKNVLCLEISTQQKDSIESWALNDSKFISKLANNSGIAEEKMNIFNDSDLFPSRKNFNFDN